jgi:tRNA-2-methylthio-N6-dimethylallyladenosine synthase
MPDQIPDEVVAERYDRLHQHLNAISLRVNQQVIGKELEVLISDIDDGKAQGKSRDFRLVHFAVDPNQARPGDLAEVKISDAKPHFILGEVRKIVKSRGGDAFSARKAEAEKSGIFLGVPQLKSVLAK